MMIQKFDSFRDINMLIVRSRPCVNDGYVFIYLSNSLNFLSVQSSIL